MSGKNWYLLFVLGFVLLIGGNAKVDSPPEEIKGLKIDKFPFYVFTYDSPRSYYVISGYMGDVQDITVRKVTESQISKNSIQLIYKPKPRKESKGWAGLYWQYPANNWGAHKKGGYNLTGAKNLFFYAKGLKGDEVIEFKVGGIQGPYGDSDQISTGLISLSRQWTLYKIDLKNTDMKNVIGGFGVVFVSPLNPSGLTMFLNDIYYTDREKPETGVFLDHADYVEIVDSIIKEKKGNELLLNISEYENRIFQPGGAAIRQEGNAVLSKVVGMINEESYKRVIIMMNVFNLQSREPDRELSKKRAEVMYDFLVKKGIDRRKLGYRVMDEKERMKSSQTSQDLSKKKVEILIIKWKKGEEEKYKYHFFIGLDAFIKEDYAAALTNWNKALALDSENEDLKRRIAEARRKLSDKTKK